MSLFKKIFKKMSANDTDENDTADAEKTEAMPKEPSREEIFESRLKGLKAEIEQEGQQEERHETQNVEKSCPPSQPPQTTVEPTSENNILTQKLQTFLKGLIGETLQEVMCMIEEVQAPSSPDESVSEPNINNIFAVYFVTEDQEQLDRKFSEICMRALDEEKRPYPQYLKSCCNYVINQCINYLTSIIKLQVESGTETSLYNIIYNNMNDYQYCQKMILKIIEQLSTEEKAAAFTDCANIIYEKLKSDSFLTPFSTQRNVLSILCCSAEAKKKIVSHRKWFPEKHEKFSETFLGRFLKYSPYDDPAHVGCGAAECAAAAQHLVAMAHVLMALMRAGKDEQNRVVMWFARLAEANADMRKEFHNPFVLSTPSFLLNAAFVLFKVCEPFSVEHKFKVNIDPRFLLKNDLIKFHYDRACIRKENIKTSKQISLIKQEGEINVNEYTNEELQNVRYNPPTQYFFIAIELFFLSFDELNRIFMRYSRQFSETGTIPDDMKTLMNMFTNQVICNQFVQNIIFLLRLIQLYITGDNTSNTLPLPLSSTISKEFSAIPEQYLLGIGIFFNFVIDIDQLECVIRTSDFGFFSNFLAVLCVSPTYVNNPHVRFRMLYAISQMGNNKEKGLFDYFRASLDKLVPSLFVFCVEAQFTDSDSQFYDRINWRNTALRILKMLWKSQHYRQQIIDQTSTENFARFFQYCIGDTLYEIETAIDLFEQIKAFETRTKAEINEADETESRVEYTRNCTNAEFLLKYAKLDVWTMYIISANAGNNIARAELFPQMAKTLNYFISSLIKKKNWLSVNDPAKYKFDPQNVFEMLLGIYLALKNMPGFIAAVVADPYSFTPTLFTDVLNYARENCWCDVQTQHELYEFTAQVADEYKRSRESYDIDEDEIPEEFQDGITFALMENPVVLPNGSRVDMTTIKQLLLDNPINPFTREPLTIEEVKPDAELKERIKRFVVERQSKKQ